MACLVEWELIESLPQMSEYRVALRHTTLLESAALEAKADDQHFIATAAPPPTNSILTLHPVGPGKAADGADAPQFFLVDKVFETESDEHACGVLGKLTDAHAHENASMMGTEHLEDGQAPPEDHAPAMAMPSPVVDPDLNDAESDPPQDEHLGAEPDLDEAQRAEGEALEASADAAATEAESGDGTASDAQSGAGSSKRARRRNRKHR